AATPLPVPPPQGGRERSSNDGARGAPQLARGAARSSPSVLAQSIIARPSPYLSPLAGRGRPSGARSGEGDSPRVEIVESPPHPTPLPASGEREQRGVCRSARSEPSSRDLPRGAVLGVLEHDAHCCKLIADAIGLFEILLLARNIARLDQTLD